MFPVELPPMHAWAASMERTNWLASAAEPVASASCPTGTTLVTGTHFENVSRVCLDYHFNQCWDWFPGLLSMDARATPVAVCMDTYEWPNEKGKLPDVMMRYGEAEASCAGVGKRLCTEFEWETACEGPRYAPFPYGFKHDKAGCINDKPYRPYSQKALSSDAKETRDKETRRLYQGEPSGSRPSCTSDHGVVDLVGNVEEWVTSSRPEWPYVSSLKGGYWSKPWTGCRGTNEAHGPMFRFYEIGFRCCVAPQIDR